MWAEHADANERRTLMRRHRWQLLAIGVVSGYLGAAPSLIWAVSAAALVFAPVLIGVSMWLYTLVFAFSALWFAHFCLGALAALRAESMPVAVRPSASVGEVIDVQARTTTNGALPGAPQPPSL
jgi:membrane protein implicated in regulation of membrane protease activity